MHSTDYLAEAAKAHAVIESGSVQGYENDVEAGVMAFLNALDGTGVRVSVIEFDALAALHVAVNPTRSVPVVSTLPEVVEF